MHDFIVVRVVDQVVVVEHSVGAELLRVREVVVERQVCKVQELVSRTLLFTVEVSFLGGKEDHPSFRERQHVLYFIDQVQILVVEEDQTLLVVGIVILHSPKHLNSVVTHQRIEVTLGCQVNVHYFSRAISKVDEAWLVETEVGRIYEEGPDFLNVLLVLVGGVGNEDEETDQLILIAAVARLGFQDQTIELVHVVNDLLLEGWNVVHFEEADLKDVLVLAEVEHSAKHHEQVVFGEVHVALDVEVCDCLVVEIAG